MIKSPYHAFRLQASAAITIEAQFDSNVLEGAWEDGHFDPFRDQFEFEAYTLKRSVERYLDDMQGQLKPKSLRNMQDVLNLLVERVPALAIQQVEPRHVQAVVNRPPSPHSRLSYYRQLRVFFRWCRDQGLRTDDPTEDVPRPGYQRKTRRSSHGPSSSDW